MKFKVTTTSTCITEYIVEADTKADAEDLFWNGEHDGGIDTDFQEEVIDSIKEV